jgi:hypothetical protein
MSATFEPVFNAYVLFFGRTNPSSLRSVIVRRSFGAQSLIREAGRRRSQIAGVDVG